MPTIGAITVGIYNHYDHTLFPEFPYPGKALTTRERKDSNEGSCASVYIPSMPSTRFFVRYAIQMPFETGTYLYFKLVSRVHKRSSKQGVTSTSTRNPLILLVHKWKAYYFLGYQ